MELVTEPGGSVWVAEAPDWTGRRGSPLKIGISPTAIKRRAERGLRHQIGQLYGIVGPGLITARHVFRGLKREMYVGDDSHADENKLAVTWAAQTDAVFAGDPFDGKLEYMAPPPNRVFAVYVSPNQMLEGYPSLFGWAEHWTWIAADPSDVGAPINWRERYATKLWTRAD